jgi:hypothetical protein
MRHQADEVMTHYSPQDLAEGWEFKILRGWFRKPEKLRAVLDEESRGGWVLVEKFDDNRIRLKRPAGAKVVEEDIASGYDPYRTTVAASQAGLFILLAVAVGLAVVLFMSVLVAVKVQVQEPPAMPRPPVISEELREVAGHSAPAAEAPLPVPSR